MQGLQDVSWIDVDVITAETLGAASLAYSIRANKRIKLKKISTVATSLGTQTIAKGAFAWTNTGKVKPQIVSDAAAIQACIRFADDSRILVEPACGACLALAYQHSPCLSQYDKVVIIVCGGNGITLDQLLAWKQAN